MAEIFLSYDSEDRETAGRVAALLESAGWTVWWDRRIPAGRTWRSVLEDALNDMRCMVVLWSKHSIESHWVKEEAEEARSLEKLVPVLIDAVKPPVGFRAIQAADLVGWTGSENAPGASQLIADLESLLGKPNNKPVDAAPRDNAIAAHAEEAQPAVRPVPYAEHHEAVPEVTSAHSSPPGPTANAASNWLNWKAGSGIAAVLALLIAGLSIGSRKQNPEDTTPAVKVETEAPPPVLAPSLTGLTITAPRNKLRSGESVDLNVEASYSDGAKSRLAKVDRWEITPEKIVSIDDTGEIKALEPGTAKIVARYGNLASDPWTVNVEAPPIVNPSRAVVAEARKKAAIESPQPKPAATPEPSRAPVASLKSPDSPTPYVNPNRAAPRENVGGYLNRAKNYRVQGNYAAAITELERARTVDPANAEVRQEIEQTKKACEAERRLGYSVNC